MRKHISTLLIAGGLFAGISAKAQVTPVPSSTFAGHYYTEVKMQISKGSGKKKSTELDMTFDEATGKFTGVSPDYPDNSNKVNFYADAIHRKWAGDTKIWFFANSNSNGIDYGKDMFDYNNMTLATFIEDGVLVIFEAGSKSDDRSKAFFAKKEDGRIRLMVKDKSKLSMDKMVAVQKAEDMINAAAGAQLKKMHDDVAKEAMMLPNETLSKTDKALKAEVTELLNSFRDLSDPSDMVCAYTTSNDWKINTNARTGIITGREIMADLIIKNRNSGRCWRTPYTLTAQYDGSGYGRLAFKTKWNMTECACAEADKHK